MNDIDLYAARKLASITRGHIQFRQKKFVTQDILDLANMVDRLVAALEQAQAERHSTTECTKYLAHRNMIVSDADGWNEILISLEQARAERDDYAEFIANLSDGEMDHATQMTWLQGSFASYDAVLREHDCRGDALAASEAERDRLREALEKIGDLAASWEGRDKAPYWNLGDIARSALKVNNEQ